MPKPYSIDLRERVVGYVEAGHSRFRIVGPRAEVFQHYAAMLTRTVTGEPDLLTVVKPMVRTVKELPDYEWSTSKKTVAIVTGEVPLDSRGSFYALAGDWVPGVCWVLVFAGLGYARWRSKQAGHAMRDTPTGTV